MQKGMWLSQDVTASDQWPVQCLSPDKLGKAFNLPHLTHFSKTYALSIYLILENPRVALDEAGCCS